MQKNKQKRSKINSWFMPKFYLGIESTAHTFGAGIVNSKGRVLSNERSVHRPKKGKGFVPAEMALHHTQNAAKTIGKALKKAKMKIENIEVVAFSQGPGIPNTLRTGATIARYIAYKYKKPLVGVNHCIAHIEIGRLSTDCKDPVTLYLSGGNTQVIAFAEGRYRIFGETQDIAIGNAIDDLARHIGLTPPYGPSFDRTAAKGKKYIELPYTVKGMDLSFSGILTATKRKYKEGASKTDLCYSFQETCFAMLTEVTERALAHTGKDEVLLVGGVAASRRLQRMVKEMCSARGAKLYVVPKEYSGDQGAMIAWNGALAHKSGQETKIKDSTIKQKWRTNEVEITWLKQ
jgi:universal protein Kae1